MLQIHVLFPRQTKNTMSIDMSLKEKIINLLPVLDVGSFSIMPTFEIVQFIKLRFIKENSRL